MCASTRLPRRSRAQVCRPAPCSSSPAPRLTLAPHGPWAASAQRAERRAEPGSPKTGSGDPSATGRRTPWLRVVTPHTAPGGGSPRGLTPGPERGAPGYDSRASPQCGASADEGEGPRDGLALAKRLPRPGLSAPRIPRFLLAAPRASEDTEGQRLRRGRSGPRPGRPEGGDKPQASTPGWAHCRPDTQPPFLCLRAPSPEPRPQPGASLAPAPGAVTGQVGVHRGRRPVSAL